MATKDGGLRGWLAAMMVLTLTRRRMRAMREITRKEEDAGDAHGN